MNKPFDQVRNPAARRALSSAHDALDRVAQLQNELPRQQSSLRDAVGDPGLADVLESLMSDLGGRMQEFVHSSRASLASISEKQREVERAADEPATGTGDQQDRPNA